MSDSDNCLKINNINNTDICLNLNKYIINNLNISDNKSYGLYYSTNNNNYTLNNIPKEYPLGFYNSANNDKDISNIIIYESNNIDETIIIYVSRGNDIGYDNGDYFRFYDESYNLININDNSSNNFLIGVVDNFYFMINRTYKFIKSIDYDPSFGKFRILYNGNEYNFSDTDTDSSFIITISEDFNNSNNRIKYYDDDNSLNVFSYLNILIDNSNIRYFYGDISFSILLSYETTNDISLSIKSFINDISNPNCFVFNENCNVDKFLENLIDLSNIICLNHISKAELKNNGNNIFYEFNIGNNNSYYNTISNELINYNYGVYDGSYVIFDICINYPIAISNSNEYIDENYVYTKKYNIIDNIVSNLDEPFNKFNYYYDAIKLNIPKDSSNLYIYILDISNQKISEYTDLDFSYTQIIYDYRCDNPININNLTLESDISFTLYNENGVPFYYEDFFIQENIYILNKFEEYIDLSLSFNVIDRYGHNINHLVQYNLTSLNINYNNDLSYILIYNVYDYESNIGTAIRLIKIHNGPFIEIKTNPNLIFINQNNNSITAEVSNNMILSLYEFIDDIDVFFYDNNNKKIKLPYELTFSSIKSENIGNIISYNKTTNSSNDYIEYGNNENDENNLKYYFTDNIIYDLNNNTDKSFIINTNDFILRDISDISYSNLNDYNDIVNIIDDRVILIGGNLQIIEVSNHIIEISDIEIYYETVGSIKLIDDNNIIDISLINLREFNILINKKNTDISDLIISGTFKDKKIFNNDKNINNNNINLNIVDIYDLKIRVLGLEPSDNLYNFFSSNNFVDFDFSGLFNNNKYSLIQDFSKIISIDISDTTPPKINFLFDSQIFKYNNSSIPIFGNDISLTYIINTNINFDIINDIGVKYDITDTQLQDFKPTIFFDDNRKFIDSSEFSYNYFRIDSDISYVTIERNNIKYPINNNIIEISDNTSIDTSGSVTIVYKFKDRSGLFSNELSLNLVFLKDIPNLDLSYNEYYDDNINIEIYEISLNDPNYREIYQDPGIFIDLSYYDISFLYKNAIISDDFSGISFIQILEREDISYELYIIKNDDICLNKIGDYKIQYKVNQIDSSNASFLTRNIKVEYNYPPEISFNYYLYDKNDISHNITFEVNSLSFEELSIYVYDFTFNSFDNYFTDASITTQIFIQTVSGIEYSEISNNIYPFTADKMKYDSINLIDNSNIFNIITKNNIDLSNIYIRYEITDQNGNSNTELRHLTIQDTTPPNIIFGDISLDYAKTYNNNTDISYESIRIDLSNNGSYKIIEELSNILFSFTIDDNYNKIFEISRNFMISISGENDDFFINNISSFDDISIAIINEISNNGISNEYFLIKDKRYIIIYDICDNQNNINNFSRILTIVSNTAPELFLKDDEYIYNEGYYFYRKKDEDYVELSHNFGDLSLNFNDFFEIIHTRTGISDLSYTFINESITSIFGDISYDISALIYSLQGTNVIFYAANDSGILSNTITFEITINFTGSILYNNNIIETSLNDLTFEAGYEINDISLIQNIKFISEYDKFVYHYDIDISYSETNFDISFVSDSNIIPFNQNNPRKGIYTLKYIVTDEKNISNEFDRTIIIRDTKGPIIELLYDNYDKNELNNEIIINKNYDFIDPGVIISDKGSDLSSIIITLFENSSNKIIYNIPNIEISGDTINLNNISEISLTSDELKTSLINNTNFSINYTALDVCNNLSSNYKNINIKIPKDDFESIIKIIFNYNDNNGEISYNEIVLNSSFNTNFNNLKQNVDSINERYDILYEDNTKLLIYEATSKIITNDISFIFDVIYYDNSGNPNDISNNTTLFSTIPDDKVIIGNFVMYFQTYETINYKTYIDILNVTIKDTKPPVLSFINSVLFSDISGTLKLPLLSNNSLNKLSNNIGYFDNDSLNTERYFINDISGSVIYKLPGIKITDTIHEETQTLNNEMLEISFVNIYDLTIIYSLSSSIIDNSYILTNSGLYIQNYNIYDKLSFNSSDISRNLIIERFEPFINLNYERDINNNIYYLNYHELYTNYHDMLGDIYDYYDTSLSFTNDNIYNLNSIFNKNIIGKQERNYKVENSNYQFGYNTRDIYVISIKCLPNNINFKEYIDENYINYKYNENGDKNTRIGLYDGTYNYTIDSSIGIRIYAEDIYSNNSYDISNLINITSDTSFVDISGFLYYSGNFSINVLQEFNRASLEIAYNGFDLSNEVYSDIFIYSTKCEPIVLQQINIDSLYEETIELDICLNLNRYMFNNEVKDTLHLSFGKYTFKNSSYRNFFNPINFSLLEDGFHNDSKFKDKFDLSYQLLYHYDKNVKTNNLPGMNASFTELIIDAGTPPLLYFYNENFEGMSGKIIVKNNIVFNKDGLVLNGNILTSDNSDVLHDISNLYNPDVSLTDKDNILKNKIILSINMDLSANNKKSFIGLTHKNLNHNIKYNNKKIIFKKYLDSNYIDLCDNQTIKHDISDNYLIDFNENNKKTNVLLFKSVIDNSNTLINSNNSIDLTEFFYRSKDHNEYNNYYNYYNKHLLTDTEITIYNYLCKINELFYTNKVKLIDVGNVYSYFNNDYLKYNIPVFSNIYDNFFSFNVQVYINTDEENKININNSKLNYIKNKYHYKYSDSLYPIDDNNLFFNDFIVTITSNISKIESISESIINKSIIFTNGNIELNDYLLDSNKTNSYLYAVEGAIYISHSDASLIFNFKENYNNSNWSIFGDISQNLDFIKIPSNRVNDISNHIILANYSTSSDNVLIFSNDNGITFSIIESFTKKINKILHNVKNYDGNNYDLWTILTNEKSGIYTSSGDLTNWQQEQNIAFELITYYRSLIEFNNFTLYYGYGDESILLKNDTNIESLDFFDTKNCNMIKVFDVSNIFFCGNCNNELRAEYDIFGEQFCIAYIYNVNDVSNTNANDLIQDLSYSILSEYDDYNVIFKVIPTTIANDIHYENSNNIIFVGYIDYYNNSPYYRSQSSIFRSIDKGKHFYAIQNSNSIFKYGYRVTYFNNKWLAFGSNIEIENYNKNNNSYNLNILATSDDGVIWIKDESSNIFDLISDIEEIEIINSRLYIYGNDNYIIYLDNSNNLHEFKIWQENIIINDISLNKNNEIYFKNKVENISYNSLSGDVCYNYIILNEDIETSDNFSIEFEIRFENRILKDDEIIFSSSDNSHNEILIKRDKNNNKLFIKTGNDNCGNDITINYELEILKFYHIIYVQENINKKVYINNELIKDADISENLFYNDNNDNNIVPSIIRNKNYINYFDNIELKSNLINEFGFSIKYVNIYSRDLSSDEINILYNKTNIDRNNFINYTDESINEILKDKIYLLLRDNDLNNEEYNKVIGITEQNLYHNIYIEDDSKFIFHNYSDETNNIQVITEDSNINKTILEKTSSKKYLLEICNNDLYNCFINNLNILDNNIYKNNYLLDNSNSENSENNVNNVKYKLHLSYYIYNELSPDNVEINNFDIRTVSTNNSFEFKNTLNNKSEYSEPYQNLSYHSHFFIIDLLDFVDRKFYDSSKINALIDYENINYQNLNFIIKDISYVRDFNIYDIDADNNNNGNIIYNKNQIYELNYIQIFIFVINIKLNYFIEYYNNYYGFNINNFNDYNDLGYNFINDKNLQNYQELFESLDYVSNVYNLTLTNTSINDLFVMCLNNIKFLKQKYNKLIKYLDLYLDLNYIYLENIDEINNISDINNSIHENNDIQQILTDASNIDLNINELLEIIIIRNNNISGSDSINDISNNIIYVLDTIIFKNIIDISNNESDFTKLLYIINNYNSMYKDFNILLYELNIRTDYYTNIENQIYFEASLNNISDNLFINNIITDNNILDPSFYQDLLNRLIIFNNLLNDFYEINNFMTTTTNDNNGVTLKYYDISFNIERSEYMDTNLNNIINISELRNEFTFIENNFYFIITKCDNNFDFISKLKIFDNINFVLGGSKFAINLFESNNVLMKIDTFYNSYLFNNIYLDTFIIDIAKPDIIKPTIIFNDSNNYKIRLENNYSRDKVNENDIIKQLVSDICYIDINTEFDIDNSYSYTKTILETDWIIFLNIDNIFNTSDSDYVDISYIIRDYAGNENIITREIYAPLNMPIFYYKYQDNYEEVKTNKIETLVINNNQELTEELLIENIKVVDPSYNKEIKITIDNITINYNSIQIDALNIFGFYPDCITYSVTSNLTGKTQSKNRDLSINELIELIEQVIVKPVDTHCCYPKVYYKEIQHSYKLGSLNTNVSRLTKIIVNNIR